MNGLRFDSQKLQQSAARRGNTIVLVTGILVLLVIIAAAYITRTQAQRVTAGAVQRQGMRDDNLQVISEFLAGVPVQALFVAPVDPSVVAPGTVPNSNAPRLKPNADAVRYSRDPNFPFNVATYQVVPFTNWPDPQTQPGLTAADFLLWPAGPGNPVAPGSPLLLGEGNPIGNPGFGDCPWLRDFEPLRWDTRGAVAVLDGKQDAFSHYKHITNIARADNAWRVCTDISDIGDATGPLGVPDGWGTLVTNLNIPIEQWLTAPSANRTANTGCNQLNPATFLGQWRLWFGIDNGLLSHETAYVYAPGGINNIPANYYALRDLDADFFFPEGEERVQDEFAGPALFPPAGTRRWNVGRILADTDGDGFTDSFWFAAPTPIQSGIRQIIAVSIVDNCAMLNVNVATRFSRNETDVTLPVGSKKTAGWMPSDLALVGALGLSPANTALNSNWNVGYYDAPDHQYLDFASSPARADQTWRFQYLVDGSFNTTGNPGAWQRHLQSVGLPTRTGLILTAQERLDYWRRAASQPLSPDPFSAYTPFNLADEIELRMYAAQNYPWIVSRYEQTVQDDGATVNPVCGFMRVNLSFEESNELLNQRYNREDLLDPRHRVTTYSAARNDIMPPWLWDQLPYLSTANFDAAPLKIDLRSANNDFNRNGLFFNPVAGSGYFARSLDYQYLQHRILAALIDQVGTPQGTYYGNSELLKTERMAAAFTANLLQWRDSEPTPVSGTGQINGIAFEKSPLAESIPVIDIQNAAQGTSRFMGMEAQPFLLEAFIGHVYKAILVTPQHGVGPTCGNYTNFNHNVVTEDPNRYSTVIAIQIANPFERPINLAEFQLKVFGQAAQLSGILPPATDDAPSTAVFYAIKGQFTGDPPNSLRDKWLDFMDLKVDGIDGIPNNTDDDLPPHSIVKDVNPPAPGVAVWKVDERDKYDSSADPAIELTRADTSGSGPAIQVVVDRIDGRSDPKFKDAVNHLGDGKPSTALPPDQDCVDIAGGDYPSNGGAVDLGPVVVPPNAANPPFDQWVQWVRVTRAWGVDVNGNGRYEQNEKNPRYIYNNRAVIQPTDATCPGATFVLADGSATVGGNKYKSTTAPDGWFTRTYHQVHSNAVTAHKPTFFDMNHVNDPTYALFVANDCSAEAHRYAPRGWSYPDKGWYTQGDSPDSDATTTSSSTANIKIAYPLQMLQKDGDFEQIGELLNVWLYGHEVDATVTPAANDTSPPTISYGMTVKTFSEFMATDNAALVGNDIRVNRLRLVPSGTQGGNLVGIGDPANLADIRHAFPPLPAGVRLMDVFVCDGYGIDPVTDLNGDGFINATDTAIRNQMVFGNAKGFDGTGTPGMINANDAPIEVDRAMPHMYRAVHETGFANEYPQGAGTCYPGGWAASAIPMQRLYDDYNPPSAAQRQPLVTNGSDAAAILPRTMLPEAIRQYVDQSNGQALIPANANPTGIPGGPNYENRATGVKCPNIHSDRGMASPAEIALLNQSAQQDMVRSTATSGLDDQIFKTQWQADMGVTAGNDKPFWYWNAPPINERDQMSMRLSTDRQDCYDPWRSNPNPAAPVLVKRSDTTAGDVEEANLLYAGISNLVTTRSDTFTIYFRVRSFRQNPSGPNGVPVWDATNQDFIVDDSRYVMLVDRSTVNHPGDKPKIVYLEKLPN